MYICIVRLVSHTDTSLQFPLALATAVSVFIILWCMDDQISQLGGWASQWRPPQGLSEHKHYNNAATNSNSKKARSRMVASLRGSVCTETKKGESSTGRVWAAVFHHVMACSRQARVFKITNRLFLSFSKFFSGRGKPRIRGSACTVFFRDVRSAKIIFYCYVAYKLIAQAKTR